MSKTTECAEMSIANCLFLTLQHIFNCSPVKLVTFLTGIKKIMLKAARQQTHYATSAWSSLVVWYEG